MNTLKRNLFSKITYLSAKVRHNKKNNKIQNNLIFNIIKRGKFRGPHQPGLSRYNYDNEDYEQLPFEVILK